MAWMDPVENFLDKKESKLWLVSVLLAWPIPTLTA